MLLLKYYFYSYNKLISILPLHLSISPKLLTYFWNFLNLNSVIKTHICQEVFPLHYHSWFSLYSFPKNVLFTKHFIILQRKNTCHGFHFFHGVSNRMSISMPHQLYILKISEMCYTKNLKQFLKTVIFTITWLWNTYTFSLFHKMGDSVIRQEDRYNFFLQ